MDLSVSHLLAAAGKSVAWQMAAIIGGTFVLEDAATVVAALAVQTGKVSLPVALIALYLGIVLGDLGLYGLGRLASSFRWARRLIPEQRQTHGRRWIERHVFKVVFVSRFLPGVRLPTYTACGFLHANFTKFAGAAVGATLIWTSALFAVSLRVGRFILAHFGEWRWAGLAGFVLVIVAIGRVVAHVGEAAQEGRS